MVGAVDSNGGDTEDCVATYTSSDVADGSATSWTSVTPMATGETHSSLFGKLSQMAKNVRYLKNTQTMYFGTASSPKTLKEICQWIYSLRDPQTDYDQWIFDRVMHSKILVADGFFEVSMVTTSLVLLTRTTISVSNAFSAYEYDWRSATPNVVTYRTYSLASTGGTPTIGTSDATNTTGYVIGFLAITYRNDNKTQEDIKRIQEVLEVQAYQISTLLDVKKST